MQYLTTEFDQQLKILKVELNRPEVHNAFDPTLIKELTEVFNQRQARIIQMSGAGKSFCSGADLAWMQSLADYSETQNQQDAYRLHQMFEAMWRCPIPIVTLAHGNVMGGALGLLACSDFVVAESSTQFGFSEVRIGLVPAVISSFIARKMARPAMRQHMLLGKIFSAQEAKDSGLIHFSGSREECQQKVTDWSNDLLNVSSNAVFETKALLNLIDELPTLDEQAKLTTQSIAKVRVSSEGQKGLRGFLSKIKVDWRKS